MSVIDASALVELLLGGRHAAWVADALDDACTLHLADSEVLAAMAGLVRGAKVTRVRAESAIAAMDDLPIDRFPAQGLLTRTLQLAGTASPYDAGYLALAEALGEPLLTLDRRLARAAPASVRVLVPPTS